MLEAKQLNVHSSKKTDVLDSIIVVATRLNLCSGKTGMKNNNKKKQTTAARIFKDFYRLR